MVIFVIGTSASCLADWQITVILRLSCLNVTGIKDSVSVFSFSLVTVIGMLRSAASAMTSTGTPQIIGNASVIEGAQTCVSV